LIIVVLAVGGPFGYRWWIEFITVQKTDNATIQGDVVSISGRVTGTIEEVRVTDFQQVKAGDVLVRLDARDLEITLASARAQLEVAERQADTAFAGIDLSQTQAGAQNTTAQGGLSLATTSIDIALAAVETARIAVSAAEARLELAQAQLDQAKQDYDRSVALSEEGVIPSQQLDHAETAYKVAQAQVDSAGDDVAAAQARLDQARLSVEAAQAQKEQSEGAVQNANAGQEQVGVHEKQYEAALAQIDLARATVQSAELQLSYATITAPADGTLGRVSVEVGQRVTAGQPLMPLVGTSFWVIANFKETQIDNIRPGMPVVIRVDAYPEGIFQGHVDSLSPASGATFALLPPENATGNFTKVVQRVPVKIVFEPGTLEGYRNLLAPGLSVVVKVKVRQR
jgi:membrane fusion protein (multidrug efflux system)